MGTAVVMATGGATELGRISQLLREAVDLQTPLTKALATIGRYLTLGILVISAVLLGVGLLRGHSVAESLLAALTLAVAAIPEGLPAAQGLPPGRSRCRPSLTGRPSTAMVPACAPRQIPRGPRRAAAEEREPG